ncbi:MAG: redoxin domain-containing protein [Solirubrobacterales bacterium]|nr:redoxin domain-containing protein [Solirubrobacterales bacterium]
MAGLAALAALALVGRFAITRRRSGRPSVVRSETLAGGPAVSLRWAGPGFGLVLVVVVGATILALAAFGASGDSQQQALASNPNVDPGTALSGPAPGFTLTDQFGKPVSLQSFRGKVVILAFTDSECTTICPMTTTAMLDAKAMLGAAGSQVQLLGIDANPAATTLEDVWSYSELHGMINQWHFLTGSLDQLRPVWKAYAVEAAIQHGQIAHTPALFVIGPQGNEAKVYVTQQSYAAIGQLGQVLAQEASSLLPGRPPVRSDVSYAQIPAISPTSHQSLPRLGGGTVGLGPGKAPRLFLFFATWDQEITSLAGHLEALDGYQSAAGASGLPRLTGVDEGSVEPSPRALPQLLGGLSRPLSYPVAIDQSGQVADGYQVQGEPWFVLTSPSGQILWYWEVDTSGWPSESQLVAHVRAALARSPTAPAGAAAAARELAGSPAKLAALHQQAGQLLGGEPALAARIRALRGYPIVINAWASWCTPCRSEFGLFAAASARYGRRVAFLGADTDDSSGDARPFLAQHPVSYPSYQASTATLGAIVSQGLEGLPTTIFIGPSGKVISVHTGQYDSQGALDGDIASYARAG